MSCGRSPLRALKGGSLFGRGCYQQLHDPAPICSSRPFGHGRQAPDLDLPHARVIVRVVTDEGFEEVGIEGVDVLGELVSVLQLEHSGAALFNRHEYYDAIGLRRSDHVFAQLFVDENAFSAERDASRDVAQSLVDEGLRLAHPREVGSRRRTGDTEQVHCDGSSLVDGQNEERLVRRRQPAVVRSAHRLAVRNHRRYRVGLLLHPQDASQRHAGVS